MKKWIFIFAFLACQMVSAYADALQKYQNNFVAELLVWRLTEASADNWAQTITPAGTTQSIHVIDVPFRWRPGVRLGVTHIQDSDWDTGLSYTAYQTKATSQASGRVFSAFLGNFFADNTDGASTGPSYQRADLLWTVDYHTLDFSFGRNIQIDPVIELHPTLGLKGAIINQHIHSNWLNPTIPTHFTSASETLVHDYYGVGPSLTLKSTFHLLHGQSGDLNLVADIAGALLWGHWHFKDLYVNNRPTRIDIINSNITGASTMSQAIVGLDWWLPVKNHTLKARLGYEAQVWFSHMQIYSFNMGRLNHLMAIHGGLVQLTVNGY